MLSQALALLLPGVAALRPKLLSRLYPIGCVYSGIALQHWVACTSTPASGNVDLPLVANASQEV